MRPTGEPMDSRMLPCTCMKEFVTVGRDLIALTGGTWQACKPRLAGAANAVFSFDMETAEDCPGRDFFRGSCTFNTTANLQMANLKMFCY